MFKIEKSFVEIQGLKIRQRIFGSLDSDNILIVLHGWNTTGSGVWQDFITQFQSEIDSQKICVLAIDLPGFAETQEPASAWSVQQYAEFVWNYIKSLNLNKKQKISLLGHSFGGGVATWVTAKMAPDYFFELFLVAPAIIRLPTTESQTAIRKITKFAKKYIKNDLIKKVWYRLIGSPDYAKVSGIMKQVFQVVVTQDLQFLLCDVKTKTTIVWGDKDTYTPIWQAEIVSTNIKDSKLLVLPEINHGIHIHAFKKLYSVVKHELKL